MITIGLDYSHNNILTLEASSYADFTQFLFTSGFKLGKVEAGFDLLANFEKYDAIILSTPKNINLRPSEIENLENYVKKGGSLLIFSSSGGDITTKTNLNELTRKFGFEFESDEVNDSMNYVFLQKRPILTRFKPHFITEQVKKIVFSSSCSTKILDFIEDENVVTPLDAASRELLRDQIRNALLYLNERERQVLELRFGLLDGRDHTLEEVGQRLGLAARHGQ